MLLEAQFLGLPVRSEAECPESRWKLGYDLSESIITIKLRYYTFLSHIYDLSSKLSGFYALKFF